MKWIHIGFLLIQIVAASPNQFHKLWLWEHVCFDVLGIAVWLAVAVIVPKLIEIFHKL